jgi:flagellar protein FlaG
MKYLYKHNYTKYRLINRDGLVISFHGGIYMRVSGTDAAISTLQTNSEPQVMAKEIVPAIPMLKSSDNTQQQNNSDTREYPVNEKVVSEAVDKMNKALEGSNRRFEYSVHEKTHGIMIKVIDETTGKVIREIPPKKILDMVANMMEMAGLLVDERR